MRIWSPWPDHAGLMIRSGTGDQLAVVELISHLHQLISQKMPKRLRNVLEMGDH